MCEVDQLRLWYHATIDRRQQDLTFMQAWRAICLEKEKQAAPGWIKAANNMRAMAWPSEAVQQLRDLSRCVVRYTKQLV